MRTIKYTFFVLLFAIGMASCGDGVHSDEVANFYDADPITTEQLPSIMEGVTLPVSPNFVATVKENELVVFRFGTFEDPVFGAKKAISTLDSLFEVIGFLPNTENTPYTNVELSQEYEYSSPTATRFYVNFDKGQAFRVDLSEDYIDYGNIDATIIIIENATIKPNNFDELSGGVQSSLEKFFVQFDDHDLLRSLPNTCSDCGLQDLPLTYDVDTLKGKDEAYFDRNWVMTMELSKTNNKQGLYMVREILDSSVPYMAVSEATGEMDEFHTGHEKGLIYLVKASSGEVIAVKQYYVENSESVYGELTDMSRLLIEDLRKQVATKVISTKRMLCNVPYEEEE